MIDEKTTRALLLEAHRLIERAGRQVVERLTAPKPLVFPPGESLTDAEAQALSSLPSETKEALRKITEDAVGTAFFNFFAVIDGVSDPARWQGTPWLGVDLSPPSVNRPMLHDALFESRHEYESTDV